jgi:MFS family permease
VPPATRRWLIVAALFAVNASVAMPLAAFGVFLPVLAETFGWSRGAIATAMSINLVLGGVAGFAVGAVADRQGPRVVLVATVALAGVSFALVSRVTALWQLYLLVGVLGGIGMSSFYLVATATVTHWFERRRGLALALVLVGFNFGYMLAGPVAAGLIGLLGWRQAYAVLGLGAGLVTALAGLTVRLPRSGDVTGATGHPSARRTEPGLRPGLTLAEALTDRR